MADQFVDSGSGTAGTVQDAAHMDALVVAQSYLHSGGIPSTSGTLVATQPATEVVINRGDGTAVFVPISATTVTMTASSDNYVDVTTAGAYTVSAVSVGAGAPSQAAQTLRLYKATTSGTAMTSVTQLATTAPVNVSMVQSAASIDSNGRVIPAPVHGVRQSILFDLDVDGTGDLTVDTTHNAGNTGLFNSYGNPKQWSITTTGGDLEVEFMGWPWNYQGTANWILLAVCVDLGPAYLLASAHTGTATAAFDATTGGSANTECFSGKKVFRGLSAGTHTVYLLLQAGGSGGGTSAGFKKGSNTSWLSVSIKEIA